MWYDYPKREDFKLTFDITINNKGGKELKKLVFNYKQASISDTMDFLKYIEDGEQSKWFEEFIKEYSDCDKIILGLLKIDRTLGDKIFEQIKDTRFRGTFGGEKKKSDGATSKPYSSVLCYVCKGLGIDPNTFQEKYTIEQMNFLIEGIVYNLNDKTEEGREANEKAQFNKTHKDEDLLALIK